MKDIYIFTNSFPYKKNVEVFIETEIEIASKNGYNIHIVPTNKGAYKRFLPENVKLHVSLMEQNFVRKVLIFMAMFFTKCYWQGLSRAGSFRAIMQATKYFFGASLTANYIRTNILGDSVLYSYWFSYTALGLALARSRYANKYSKCRAISRGHGYDIFDDERNVYIPLREFTIANIDSVYSVSEAGAEHLKQRFPQFSDKISVAHLGVMPTKINTNGFHNQKIHFVSCSSVIALKRVDLILEMVNNYAKNHSNIQIKWTHFGSGQLLDELQTSCKNVADNLVVKLAGFAANEEVRRYYADGDCNIFVNLSLYEGIPVSIMEALSAGLAVIATNVGGNSEIVNTSNGALLAKDFTYSDFEAASDEIIANYEDKRQNSLLIFEANFNAERNYKTFYREIVR